VAVLLRKYGHGSVSCALSVFRHPYDLEISRINLRSRIETGPLKDGPGVFGNPKQVILRIVFGMA
jgi:hypothetical protein